MASLTHKCPHCLTEHIALVIAAVKPLSDSSAYIHLDCPKCFGPSAALVKKTRSIGPDPSSFVRENGDISWAWEVKKYWPEPPAPNIPNHVPPDVGRIYLQAERNYPIEGNEEAAGTMYRKALDVGLKKIDSTITGTLKSRIKSLATKGKLTDNLAEWADNVRDLGNEAAHEESPPTRDDLTELRSFTEMVMRYLFTLPNMVRKRRGEQLEWETEGE